MENVEPVPARTGVGVIGCGNISKVYLQNLGAFANLELVACADVDRTRAETRAAQFGLAAETVEELLADDRIGLVVNLTVPDAHAEVSRAALKAGKHVYSEKPLATRRKDARRLIRRARKKGLRIGGAPDTFLGGAWQTVRQLVDRGAIGEPVAATAFMMGHGPESWHPNPDFFYQPGAGPLFDMGPYYLTALISIFGPVHQVAAVARASFPERLTVDGRAIPVNTPTHVAGSLEFASGALATLVTSFDVWHSQVPRMEIYGSEGTIRAPDPNEFGGVVSLRGKDDTEWRDVPVELPYVENCRGVGVADLARAIQTDTLARCEGEMAYHVVEVMSALLKSAERGRHIRIKSECARPAPLAESGML